MSSLSLKLLLKILLLRVFYIVRGTLPLRLYYISSTGNSIPALIIAKSSVASVEEYIKTNKNLIRCIPKNFKIIERIKCIEIMNYCQVN